MGVGEAILALGAGERPASFDQFSAAIDPQWIADALAATDTASVRRPKLPAEHVVWLVIGMGCGAGAGAKTADRGHARRPQEAAHGGDRDPHRRRLRGELLGEVRVVE